MEDRGNDKRDAEQRGLVCRQCGCRHFWVLYTRGIHGGRLMRRRECRHCGKRITTWERAIGQ
jgi:transcriptional regulator NrdR family protein